MDETNLEMCVNKEQPILEEYCKECEGYNKQCSSYYNIREQIEKYNEKGITLWMKTSQY